MLKLGIRSLIATALLLVGVNAPAEDGLRYSNKWRIECSGGAESTGAIQLRVTPRGGAPTEITVQVEKGRGENGVARDIRDALRTQLPAGRYDVETDDGEDVLVKKNFNEPDFAIEVVASTVEDVRLRMDRE